MIVGMVFFFLSAPVPGFSLIWKSGLSFYTANKPRIEKKCPSQLQRSKMKMWWCLCTAEVEKKNPNKPKANLKKKQSERDLLVYKTQWFLEHWLMMPECLGLPKAVNRNVTLVCLGHIWEISFSWQRWRIQKVQILKGCFEAVRT